MGDALDCFILGGWVEKKINLASSDFSFSLEWFSIVFRIAKVLPES